MPGTVKVKVVAARNLPIMDRATFLTDAFVEVRLGNTTMKTEVARRSLNPYWNCDWFKFELDDQELQEEALQIRVLDHDTYSSHDAIGRVYLDLNPLLVKHHNRAINGWFPIYDTMHGIRGEINLIVRVDIFSDASRFRQSSVGVRFFYSTCVPHGYRLVTVLGFLEELLMNDDPEYQLMDKLRTSRASNEARQQLFSKLNGELQRKLGVKVLEIGGNSVIGYQLHFDLEGETGIVVRGIGTAATLVKIGHHASTPPPSPHLSRDGRRKSSIAFLTLNPAQFEHSDPDSPASVSPVEEATKGFTKMFRFPVAPLNNSKSVDYVEYPFLTLCQPPQGFILNYGSVVSAKCVKLLDKMHNLGVEECEARDTWWTELRTEVRSHMKTLGCTSVMGYREECSICEDVIVLSAYGTAVKLNASFEHHTTGPPLQPHSSSDYSSSPLPGNLVVSLDRSNFDRERWRIPSVGGGSTCSGLPISSGVPIGSNQGHSLHVDIALAREMAALDNTNDFTPNSGMPESTPIRIFNPSPFSTTPQPDWTSPPSAAHRPSGLSLAPFPNPLTPTVSTLLPHPPCSLCHVTFSSSMVPYPVVLARCTLCLKGYVPDILFSTTDLPEELPLTGLPALLQARVCRGKRECKGESAAKEISDCLPFIEYDLHQKLMQKLKLKGMNALFGLRIRISIGESVIVALGTATGVYATALPPPQMPTLTKKGGSLTKAETEQYQQELRNHVQKNKEFYNLDEDTTNLTNSGGDDGPQLPRSSDILCGVTGPPSTNSGSDLDIPALSSPTRDDLVVVETEDMDVEDLFPLLGDQLPPKDLILATTDRLPPVPLSQLNVPPTRSNSIAPPGSALPQSGLSQAPPGPSLFGPGGLRPMWNLVRLVRVPLVLSGGSNELGGSLPLVRIMREFTTSTWFKFRKMRPCALTGLDFRLTITEDEDLIILATGMCISTQQVAPPSSTPLGPVVSLAVPPPQNDWIPSTDPVQDLDDVITRSGSLGPKNGSRHSSRVTAGSNVSNTSSSNGATGPANNFVPVATNGNASVAPIPPSQCIVTPLTFVTGAKVDNYLGNLDFFFVRETNSVREYGGVSGFVQSCLSEVQSVVSAHTLSLGGNAFLSFHLSEIQLVDSAGRNQAQVLLNVCGDMAKIIPYPPPGQQDVNTASSQANIVLDVA